MKYQEWSKRKFWFVLAAVFILGFWIAPNGRTEVVEKRVEVQADLTDWKALKETDDRAISQCSQALLISSEGMTAFSNFDVEGMEKMNKDLEALLPLFQNTAKERLEILGRLDY